MSASDIPPRRLAALDQSHANADSWLESVTEHMTDLGMADVDAATRAPGIYAALERLDYDADTLRILLTAALVRLCEPNVPDLEGIDPS
jgi:hypothetical protein